MQAWFFAALLTGSVLTCAECAFIVLTCGPFWVGPALFLRTWLIYAALAAAGLVPLNLVVIASERLRKRFPDSRLRFSLNFGFAWLTGAALLVLLVARDSYAESQYPMLALLLALVGVVATLLIRRWVRHSRNIAAVSLALSLCLVLLVTGVYLISQWHYGAAVSQRSATFRGAIPNVCLVVMDAARGDHFSCNGYPFETTPNVDRMAREGLLCRNAYSASNWTPPGHISIFTGKYPAQHGNNGQTFMPDDLLSLTEVLSQQGYYCVALYNNPTAGRNINLTQGFDCDIGVYGHSWVYPAPFRLWNKLVLRGAGAKITFLILERTFQWMQKRGAHLFVYVNVTEAHSPYLAREPYFSHFTQGLNRDRIGALKQVKELCRTQDLVLNDSLRFSGFTEESYAYLRAAYDSGIAYVDNYLGRFADAMRAAGQLDQTLLIITSDHGEFLGEHFTLGHPELMLNPVLSIPLIFRYPALIPSRIRPEYVSNVDVFPTVLNLLCLPDEIPADVQGCDLLSDALPADRPLLAANISPEGGCYSLIEDNHKLVLNDDNFLSRYFPADTLLFDIRQDPQERVNLAQINSAKRIELARHLDEWLNRIEVRPQSAIRVSKAAMTNFRSLGYVR